MRKKKNGGDKPNQAIIHRIYVYTQNICIYTEVPQGNALCSYLKQAKMAFYCLLFSYTKSENRRAEQVLPRGRVFVPEGGARMWGNGEEG
jgi:hypothetical protein